MAWEHRQDRGVQQTNQERDHGMTDEGHKQAKGMKGQQVLLTYLRWHRHRRSCEQVDRVPGAAGRDDAVGHCHDGHGNTADNPTLDTSRIRMDLCRDTHPMATLPK